VTGPAAPYPFVDQGDFIEIADRGVGFDVVWSTSKGCGCTCRRLLWFGGSLYEARRVASSWADALGGLPVLDRARLH
jgi:hypothetical protein